MDRKRRARATSAAMLCLALICQCALAGARGPLPALLQFSHGYEVVAAEVVSVARVYPPPSWLSDFTFRIHQILAHPTADQTFPAEPGDTIRARLSVCIYGEVARTLPDSLAPGGKFILTLKHASSDEYEHAEGSDAAEMNYLNTTPSNPGGNIKWTASEVQKAMRRYDGWLDR